MSHISNIELEVNDLATLKRACHRLGLEFIEGKTHFKWWGGKDQTCDHAIAVPGADYEIGVQKVENRYELQVDYYDQAIEAKIGKSCGLFKQAYAVERTSSEARLKGYTVSEKRTDQGVRVTIKLN